MLNGILLVDKPAGFTSHDAVAKLRGMLRQKKIGHAGTLDPMATGLLVVLLGCATRASSYAAGQEKEYHAVLRLGIATDTQDVTGKVLTQAEPHVTAEQLQAVLAAFTGTVEQLPPMYSALSVGGKRLYELARKGVEVERQAREIEISALEFLPRAGLPEGDFALRVVCSKGTYIRALCHDIGQTLGCGGCMAALRRVRSGGFSLADALTIEEVAALRERGGLEQAVIPVERVFSDLPAVLLNGEGDVRADHGAFFTAEHLAGGQFPPEGGLCRVFDSKGSFCQIGRSGTLDKGGPAIFCHVNFECKE
ncbi:MAG: tRNA pseudouridine(55) synthase TruB [Clostridia bacterium]|nr:tRNA pseudouridine(55) synthase TruB [Clostridia bacterium]